MVFVWESWWPQLSTCCFSSLKAVTLCRTRTGTSYAWTSYASIMWMVGASSSLRSEPTQTTLHGLEAKGQRDVASPIQSWPFRLSCWRYRSRCPNAMFLGDTPWKQRLTKPCACKVSMRRRSMWNCSALSTKFSMSPTDCGYLANSTVQWSPSEIPWYISLSIPLPWHVMV